MAVKIGFQLDTQEAENLIPSKADMSVIGALVTAPNKDPSISYNTPYAINSDDAEWYTKLGATGTAQAAMLGVAKQLGQLKRSVRMVMVVVDAGANVAAAIANMVGNAVTKTGVHAFRKAAQAVGRIPRVIMAPGHTAQFTKGAVLSLAIAAAGTGYTNGSALTAVGAGTGFTGTIQVTGGLITGVTITNKGTGYVNGATTFTIGGGGTGGSVTGTVGNLANAVCAELPTVLEGLLAVACVSGPATNRQDAIDWRETLGSKRLIPTDCDVYIQGPNSEVVVDSAPYIAGMINRVDDLHGGMPFHAAGNREIYGVLGPSRIIDYSLTDDATEGQELLNNDIGIIVRGEAGDDFSITEGGTIYLGVSTASNESLWQYYNQVRGRDWIHITMLKTLRELLVKNNITGRTIQAFVSTMRNILADLAADELIHKDFDVALIPALNSVNDLRDGQITVKMAVEEPAPLLRGRIKSNRYEFALTSFIANLAAQINQEVLV